MQLQLDLELLQYKIDQIKQKYRANRKQPTVTQYQ